MMRERLIDLDELILRCRDKKSQVYITEAVSCYRAGAFRSCIVATWIAVVFDFLNKLNELELTGDQQARSKREEFDRIRQNDDVKQALIFEKSVLDMAKDDFKLITGIEYIDFQRLLEDRHRCAHPSMNNEDEVYNPTGELARYHLHNAVAHMLQLPPVQGRAALERLQKEVLSEYFPTDKDDAIAHFAHGPLARPRDSLVRNFTILLLKMLLPERQKDMCYKRQTTALIALRHWSQTRPVVEATLAEKLNDIVRNLDDSKFGVVLLFLRDIQDNTVWNLFAEDVQIRIRNFVVAKPVQALVRILSWLLDFEPLRDIIQERIPTLTTEQLQNVVPLVPRPEFLGQALTLYAQSGSYDQANSYAENLILPLIPCFNEQTIYALFDSAAQNRQIYDSRKFHTVVNTLCQEHSNLDILCIALSFYEKHKNDYLYRFVDVMKVHHIESYLNANIVRNVCVKQDIIARVHHLVTDGSIAQEKATELIQTYNLDFGTD